MENEANEFDIKIMPGTIKIIQDVYNGCLQTEYIPFVFNLSAFVNFIIALSERIKNTNPNIINIIETIFTRAFGTNLFIEISK